MRDERQMDTETLAAGVLLTLIFSAALSLVVGITWNGLAETSAIENMVMNGADPIASACSMGSVTACETAERIQAYGLRRQQ